MRFFDLREGGGGGSTEASAEETAVGVAGDGEAAAPGVEAGEAAAPGEDGAPGEEGEGEEGEGEGTVDPLRKVDDALGAVAEQDWYAALDDELERSGRDVWSIDPEEIRALPLPAQKMVHNLRRMHQRSTQKFSEAAKTALEKEHSLSEKERLLQVERKQVYDFVNNPAIQQFLDSTKPEPGRQVDPYSEEGQKKRFGEFAQQFVEAMAAAQEQNATLLEKEREKVTYERTKEEVSAYVSENDADFKDPEIYGEIKGLLERTRKDGRNTLSVQEAHRYVVSARRAAEFTDEARSRSAARRFSQPSTGGSARPQMPAGLSTEQQLAWLESNDDDGSLLERLADNGY